MRSHSPRRLCVAILLAVLGFLMAFPAGGADRVAKEYAVKAAFLYNFAQFVEWPEDSFAESNAPIVIGIIGENPFGTALEETIKGEQVQKRKLVVKYLKPNEDFYNCQILFISRSEKERVSEILERANKKAILTIGDHEGFGLKGGMINLKMQDTVRFEINREVAEGARLRISSKVLSLAIPVKTRR
jgi:hypothetical protein